jgi:triosephosphate isomerase
MARRKLVAANWKMNGTRGFGAELVAGVARLAAAPLAAGVEVLICPPATLLISLADAVGAGGLRLGGQDCHPERSGPFTGDISAPMLVDAGCSHVIVGHSERRTLHHETSADVCAKATAALAEGLVAVICVGETEAERDAGEALAIVGRQIAESLPEGSAPENVVVAYEPVWAIGTGRVAATADVAEMHAHIRSLLPFRDIRILYGGSVKPSNAVELFALEDVDGALVGGASLDAASFGAIVAAAAG